MVPNGFLVPLKQAGGLYLLKIDCNGTTNSKPFGDTKPFEISAPKTSWFYHMVVWRDMNGDSLLDVTARAHHPFFGKPSGQLL